MLPLLGELTWNEIKEGKKEKKEASAGKDLEKLELFFIASKTVHSFWKKYLF
jgi:hypothetical protein